jgi:catechol 2,3-dioxygenase-like lactoylglutathione lyase family enzyme
MLTMGVTLAGYRYRLGCGRLDNMRVTALDHVVLRVTDMERSVAFYESLGLATVRLDEWRRGEAPFVSMRVDANTIIDLQSGELTGTNVDHIALVVADVDLAELVSSGRFGDVRPPRELFGARGLGQGIYVTDPDGHTVELRTYPA